MEILNSISHEYFCVISFVTLLCIIVTPLARGDNDGPAAVVCPEAPLIAKVASAIKQVFEGKERRMLHSAQAGIAFENYGHALGGSIRLFLHWDENSDLSHFCDVNGMLLFNNIKTADSGFLGTIEPKLITDKDNLDDVTECFGDTNANEIAFPGKASHLSIRVWFVNKDSSLAKLRAKVAVDFGLQFHIFDPPVSSCRKLENVIALSLRSRVKEVLQQKLSKMEF